MSSSSTSATTSTTSSSATSNTKHNTESGSGGEDKSKSNNHDLSVITQKGELNQKLSSSKYDFIKVRVHIDKHYYILSRFIVSRMLGVTGVSYKDSIKIALELKKRLVDLNLLDVTQQDLYQYLFAIMTQYNYPQCIDRFRMMTQFHHKRIPLMILMYGTGCVGKSTLATQLAERLNIPNVLQTDLVLDLLSSVRHKTKLLKGAAAAAKAEAEGSGGAASTSTTNEDEAEDPVWLHKMEDKEEFINKFKKECITMRSALEGDIMKCFEDGKSIIIEGSHIDPSLFKNLIGEMQKGIVVPFFLSMHPQEHVLFQEQWLAARDQLPSFRGLGDDFEQKLKTLSWNFIRIEEYLKSIEIPGTEYLTVNIHELDKTLDSLHQAVLKRIEDAYKKGIF